MASQTSFKQACPSCEYAVPIRDPKFIGRKIECPKCKYKFVVEDPDAAGDDDAPKGKGKTKAKAKPKKAAAGNSTLYIGLGIAAAAVIVLGLGAYLMFGGEDTPSRPSTPPAPRSIIANANADAVNPDTPPADQANQAAAPAAVAANPGNSTPSGSSVINPGPGFTGEITNLLPNDTQSVLDLHMDQLRYSTAGRQAFESRSGFKPGQFKDKIGISQDEMTRFIRGEHLERGWAFNIIQTHSDINAAAVQAALKPTKVRKGTIKGRPYLEIPPNELLDSLGGFISSELEKRDTKSVRKNKDRDAGPLGVAMLNSKTLVIAHLDILEEILEQDCKPNFLSKRGKTEDDPNNPGNPYNPSPDGGGKPGGRSMSAPLIQTLRQQSADPNNPDDALATNNTFMTIKPELKQMLERLELDPKKPALALMALLLQADDRAAGRLSELTAGVIDKRALPLLRVLGLSVQRYELEKFQGTLAIELFNENDAKQIEELIKKQVNAWAVFLSVMLQMKIDAEGGDGAAPPNPFGADIQQPQQTPGTGRIPGRGGAAGGGQGNPNNPNQPDRDPSKLIFSRKTRTLMFRLDLNLTSRAHDVLYGLTENRAAMMRGMVDMAGTRSRWPQLAKAATELVKNEVKEEEGARYFKRADAMPKATFPRAISTTGRMARTWPPSQRVSWMAGLLPYVGMEEVYADIAKDQYWRNEVNSKAGAITVPAFLDPRYPTKSQRATVGNFATEYAATHFVGVAGVGLDAADYATGDKAVEKKIGLFGYERSVSVKDVTDGAANTVMMIQVPPDIPRPWIAGGGATVVGVPEAKSLRPFTVSIGGRKGTYVMMLDGSVRFLTADTSDAVFQALCTYKGGEPVEDLEKIAPKVKPGDKAELKTVDKESDDKEKEKESDDKDK